MKKMVSVFLAAVMLLSCAVCVFANDLSDDMSAAILGAKEKIGLDDASYVLENCYETVTNGQVRYNIVWKSRDAYENRRISAEADKDGILWGFSEDASRTEQPFPVGSGEAAEEAAMAFLKHVNPEIAENVEMTDCEYETYNCSYTVSFRRMHQGIPVDNSATVSVHGETNRVLYFYSNWAQNVTFPEGTFITAEEAKKIFKENIGYSLAYAVVSSYEEKSEAYREDVRLIYTLSGENRMIDAFTGEVKSRYEMLYDDAVMEESGAAADKNTAASGNAALSAEEIAYLEEIEQLLTREEAENKVRSIPEFSIPEDVPMTRASLGKAANGKYIYTLTFTNDAKDEDYRYAGAQISAKDGTVLYFYQYSYHEEAQELTEMQKQAQAEKNAEFSDAFLTKYYSAYHENCVEKERTELAVSYTRTKNGIPFTNNGFSFGFAPDGTLNRFRMDISDAAVPEANVVKTAEEIYETALNTEDFYLYYLPSYKEGRTEMIPVYYLRSPKNYCPETGKPLGYDMLPEEEKAEGYTDISGHYGETAITSMYGAGYILGDETATEFVPAGTVKQEEFLTFIGGVLSFGDYRLYQRLVEKGVLTKEEIAPEKEITRMEAIRYIVGMLELSNLAESEKIFADIYTDVKVEDKGYAAIAAGYGIVNSKVTELYPDSLLKRSDAVIMMYNWLTK